MLMPTNDKSSLDNLQLYIFPGNPPPTDKGILTYNRAFRFWWDFWSEVFRANGTEEKPIAENFTRQNLIFALENNAHETYGMICSSIYNLESAILPELSYFQEGYPIDIVHELRAKKIPKVMTLEYLGATGSLEIDSQKISNASLFFGMACTHFLYSNIDAIIASCRADRKVDRKLAHFGAQPIGPSFDWHGTPCQPMLLQREDFLHHHSKEIFQAYSMLWRDRVDLGNQGIAFQASPLPLPRRQAA